MNKSSNEQREGAGTNKQRRERGDWPHNERMIHESQQAWMQPVTNHVTGTTSYVPCFSKGVTYVKPETQRKKRAREFIREQ